jgi:hypothetical protein
MLYNRVVRNRKQGGSDSHHERLEEDSEKRNQSLIMAKVVVLEEVAIRWHWVLVGVRTWRRVFDHRVKPENK